MVLAYIKIVIVLIFSVLFVFFSSPQLINLIFIVEFITFLLVPLILLVYTYVGISKGFFLLIPIIFFGAVELILLLIVYSLFTH